MDRLQVIRTCQFWADVTKLATSAYKLKDGSITYQLADWPVRGIRLASCQPEEK